MAKRVAKRTRPKPTTVQAAATRKVPGERRRVSKTPKKVVARARTAKAARTAKPASGMTERVREVLAWLERTGTKATRDGMARYAIPSTKAYGVPVGVMRAYAKRLGKDHELALALWKVDRYEARMLATFLDEPARVTAAQMDAWCEDFDNWAICDTACFHLFDRTPHAFEKVKKWAVRREEFVKRSAFALIASLSVHAKATPDEPFLEALLLIERGASDERNFVKKAVNWALRSVGKRNRVLHRAALDVSQRLAAAGGAAARWVGKDALRELSGASVLRRLSARGR
jgi:3-methyladenine DNA glycosylase AlkD